MTIAAPRAPSAPDDTGSLLARRRAAAAESIRASLSGSPGRLRLLGAVAIAVCLVGGVLGAFALQQRAAALDRAQADTAQLVRVQSIFSNLVRADADATNAYLIRGLEPAAQRAEYNASLALAAGGIAEASKANTADTELGRVNEVLIRYAGLVETARVNNRAGLPVGSAYIRQASALLRSDDGLRALDKVVTATGERVDSAYRRSALATWLLIGAGLIVVAGMVAVQVSLARRSHRYLNVPIAVGTLVVVIGLVAGAVTMVSAQNRADDVRDGPYADTVALAKARIGAFDAKANESLTLIARGSGGAFEADAQDGYQKAQKQLTGVGASGRAATADLQSWVVKHQQIRTRDDRNDWDGAVALATRAPSPGATPEQQGSNQTFDAFDTSSGDALAAQARAATSELGDTRAPLLIVAILLLLAGIAAAVASWAGVSLRLEEYR